MLLRFVAAVSFFALVACGSSPEPVAQRPNVLFIAIDDMNDWTTLFDPANPIRTPNLQRLAARGTFFARAYTASPACNPSRAALLTGVSTAASGVYGNQSDWRRALPDAVILPELFRRNGYQTWASGKIFHHHGTAFHAYEAFDDYLEFPVRTPDEPMPAANLNGVRHWTNPDQTPAPDVSPNFDWGVWPPDPADHIDNRTVGWAIDKLRVADDQTPFFLAVGIFRPHMPFFVPEPDLEAYRMDGLTLPELNKEDLWDLPDEAAAFLNQPGYRWMSTFLHESKRDSAIYQKAVRAYQASSTFADYQVGRLLDALDESGKAGSTLIVLWSDHGYHLGEKGHWEKFTLYEKATHVPLIIVAPNQRGRQVTHEPVSLLDLYPTLAELCDLPVPESVQGESLVALLRDPEAPRAKPAVMTYGKGNHAVRDRRYRYIRYAGGAEELYATEADPNEWTNLADRPESRAVMNRLAQFLPETDADPIGPVD